MSRVNYREAAHRFTHIDAHFSACEIGLPEHDGFFSVELYPWWEHPLYIAARDMGASWGFENLYGEGLRLVTVYPQRVYEARLSRGHEVTDWDFTQEHPLLWQYEQKAEITCNAPLPMEQWGRLAEAVRDKLTGYNRHMRLAEHVDPMTIHRWGSTQSFSLGTFPRPLFLVMREVLTEWGVPCFALREPEPSSIPTLFLIDNYDYIIANDFELDVPEFTHKAERFQPQ